MNHSTMWRLAGPMIVSNISIALLGLVDTAVVGHLGQPYYLGGIAIGAIIFDFIYWGMGFLRMSTTGLTAQIHGQANNKANNQDDNTACRTILAQSLITAFLIAMIVLIFQKHIADLALWLLEGSEEVTFYARTYFEWSIWGAPAVLSLLVMTGWFLGMQNAKATLIVAVTVNIINVVLDFVFVFGLDMDVRGVALASVISLYIGVFVAIFLVARELRINPGEWLIADILHMQRLKEILALNQDIFIRTICLIFVFAFFTRQGAKQGDVILAANAILLNFQALMALGLDGFANATEALVGKAVGAKNRKVFVDSVKTATFWSFVVAISFALIFALVGKSMINILTDILSIRAEAYQYLPWMILSPIVAVWCFLLDGIFIGATRAKEMRNSMLISTFLIFLPAWYVFQGYGNHGLWLAFIVFFVARGLTLAYASLRIERDGGFIPIKY
ncbi:MAG: MATE family efflux transporter [Gammaproteobacteria bacterium]|nr:MAG: MATE family efflux transporter [Gammaproteobacteria bacterium]